MIHGVAELDTTEQLHFVSLSENFAKTQRPRYCKPSWRWTVGPLHPQPAQALHLFPAPGTGEKTVHRDPNAGSNPSVSRSPQERKMQYKREK